MKYKITGHVTVSCYCEVEADSEEQAREKASALGAALGGTNSGNQPDEWWIIEEADGTPEITHVEKT